MRATAEWVRFNFMKPPLEEARQDLANIRAELETMRRIKTDTHWLSCRDDVDAQFYRGVAQKTEYYIVKGEALEKHILNLYPELR